MWPNMEQDIIFGKLDAIRDLIRIAYGTEGENRARLFETASSMIVELGQAVADKAPEMEEDE